MSAYRKFQKVVYQDNPFIETTLHKSAEREVHAGSLNLDSINGRNALLSDKHYLNAKEFVHVYEGAVILMTGIGRAALQLFNTMIKNLELNEDRLVFDPDVYAKKSGKSKSQVYRLVRELIIKKFIARAPVNNGYFININLICKGDKITILNQYIKRISPISPPPANIASSTDPSW